MQKTIVIFIRHFLCFMAKEYVEDLSKIPERSLQNANVRLVVIGCGPDKFIQPFREATGYQYELYVDPERHLYKAFRCLERPETGILKNSVHVKSSLVTGILKSMWRGMKYQEFQGDLDQLGGAFILGPGNIIEFAHTDRFPTDHRPINDLLGLAGVAQVNFDRDARVMTL